MSSRFDQGQAPGDSSVGKPAISPDITEWDRCAGADDEAAAQRFATDEPPGVSGAESGRNALDCVGRTLPGAYACRWSKGRPVVESMRRRR